MSDRLIMPMAACALALLLSACGGGGSGPRAPNPPTGVGASGGTVSGPAGSQVVVPAGALSRVTDIAIAASASGAPARPAGMREASGIFAMTPHGTGFTVAATVTIPYDASRLPSGITPALYKTNAQSTWERVDNATLGATVATAQVSSFSWFVVGAVPPQVTQVPVDTTVNEGDLATFRVAVLGVGPLSYQWQWSTDGGATFVDIPGATADSYTFLATAAENTALFRVIIGSPEGSTISAAARLTVTKVPQPPVIVLQPQDATVTAGSAATFSVAVTSATANPTFQWMRSNNGGTTFVDIAGETGLGYELANAQLSDNAARFRVRVSNVEGTVTSNSAQLTVVGSLPATGARIGGGFRYSMARLSTGELVSWGSDDIHQLGAGSAREDRTVPGPVISVSGVVSIAAGPTRALAVLATGAVWGWGASAFGELGQGNNGQVPAPIAGVSNVRAACAGNNHTLFLLADATVWAVGSNEFGQLGDGSTVNSRATPGQVPGLQNITAISCGSNYSLALEGNGTVRAWGLNTTGQLGDGSMTNRSTPVLVAGLTSVSAIAAGESHSLALRNGTVWSWGANFDGELGDNTIIQRSAPAASLAAVRFTAIAAGGGGGLGGGNSMALRDDGAVFVWGSNRIGQLGVASVAVGGTQRIPLQMPGLNDIVEIALANSALIPHTMLVRADGTVLAWGANANGEIGNGTSGNPVLLPQPVSGLDID